MPGALSRLFVVLGADTSKFQKEMRKVERDFDQTSQKLGNFGRMMTAAVTLPLAAAGVAVTKLAMDAIESENLFEVSMGNMAGAAREWSEQLRQQLGLNAYELRRNVGLFYTMFESMKLTSQDAYTLSTNLTQLAYDMASFYNLRPEEAFKKLRAGIVGETEPLKALGILVNENTVKTYAYTKGIAEQGAELSEQQKVMARYVAIMDQTSKAQGDLARTIDSPTNQLRIMRERAVQLGIDLGMALIPVLKDLINISQPLTERIQKAANWFTNLDPAAKKTALTIAGLVLAAGPLALTLFGVTTVISKFIGGLNGIITFASRAIRAYAMMSAGVTGFGGALKILAGGPVGLVIMSLGALVAAGIALYQNWNKVKYYGLQAWSVLKAGMLNNIRIMLMAMEKLIGWIPGMGEKIRSKIAELDRDIALENATFSARAAAYEMGNLADETDRYVQAQKRATMVSPYGGTDTSQLGTYAPKEDMKKVAQDTREEWEKTNDRLTTGLQILQIVFNATSASMSGTASKAQLLRAEYDSLAKQIEQQKLIVDNLRQAHQAAVVAKGADAEETKNLELKLREAEAAQADMEKRLRETGQAIKTQSQDLRNLADEVTKAKKKYQEDLAAALEDYQKKVKETNAKLAEDERKLTQEYENQVDQRARSLRDFVGLFDAVQTKNVSGAQLLENLRGQVKAFEDWQENIAALAARGVDEGLIEELRQMGPKAGPEIAALNTLTDEQLVEYVSMWRTKNEEARAEAINQLAQQRIEMQQKLMEIRAAATEQLNLYKAEWEKKNAEIRKNAEEEMRRIEDRFRSISEAGTKYGVSLMENFIGGIESQFDRLQKVLEDMAMTVDSYMPHSPAKVGPLKRLNEWGPSLVKSLTEGIKAEMPRLSAVATDLAAAIRNPVVNVAPPAAVMAAPGGPASVTINIYGHNYEEIASKLKRDLARAGVKLFG